MAVGTDAPILVAWAGPLGGPREGDRCRGGPQETRKVLDKTPATWVRRDGRQGCRGCGGRGGEGAPGLPEATLGDSGSL